MNIKDIEYFNELITTKNFSIVAQNFNVSQPTITMAIKRLEEEFNTKFFIRNKSHKELIVTDSGKQFYEHSKQIIQELKVAAKEIRNADEQKIIFGLPPIIGTYYFPPVTPELLRNNLLDDLTIVSRGSTVCRKMLLNGDLDIALLGSNYPLKESNLITETFARSPYKIIVGYDHPWANRQSVSIEELRGQRFISQNESFVQHRALKKMARLGHFRLNIVCQTDNVNILKALVAENIGISLQTAISINPDDHLHAIDIEAEDFPTFNMSIAYHARHYLTDKQQKVLDILRKSI
ncbi:LysR family transcriptional regulator [Ligilactobacillus aviarius]|uniref:LysR family transcriptional regulator n=1 Tax=Ligilactobacillus aviarius TaxID=1606 RepID=UPI0024BAE4AD|nr:LysR family transcriptional regulator [Ligilactobacillus aviarius]